MTERTSRPAGVEVSSWVSRASMRIPRSSSSLMVLRVSMVERPSQSSRVTTMVSPCRAYSLACSSPGWVALAPEVMSL